MRDISDRFWRSPTADDLIEFDSFPSARYLIREHARGDIPDQTRAWRRPGARPLVIIFRSGHQLLNWDGPGWHALGRAIRSAEWALEEHPALAADAKFDPRLFKSWQVSLLVSGFVYVDAPAGLSFCHWGIRIGKDVDPAKLPLGTCIMAGAYQRLIDADRGFDRRRLSGFDASFLFPRNLLTAPRSRGKA